ncbi:hypothetical protein EC991_009402 [Linnemannia zychae]|nr:hypothetical protein EC991_009402 [Linnemannia zychae]
MTPEEQESANQAFIQLQERVTALETSLEPHMDSLNHLKAHKSFFVNITHHMEDKQRGLEDSLSEKIERSDLTSIMASFRDDLLATITALVKPSSDQPSSSSKPKVDAPAIFSGKREDWKTFQSQMELFFLNAAPLYPKDVDKIMYTVSRLGDTGAFKYMEPHIKSFKLPEETRPLLISDLAVFFKTMSRTFGVAP